MAEDGTWPSIEKHGLLSTSALLDLYGIAGRERCAIESHQRKEMVRIHDSRIGSAIIRDQKVLHESALANNVEGMSVKDYYKLLNGKTFFWARKERLESFINGKEYRNMPHDVLTVDTRELVGRHEKEIWLSRINSGAFFGSGKRGANTFKKIADYPSDPIRKERKILTVVEVAVDYAVKDISDVTVKVEKWNGTNPVETVWRRANEPSE